MINDSYFIMWNEDKMCLLNTMHRNMYADLNVGYNPMGACIRRQREEIDAYVEQYDREMEKLAGMTEKQAERWCYCDMVRRGVIEP